VEQRPGYRRRQYRRYVAYLQHQSRKLPRLDLSDYDREYRTVLRERLEQLPQNWRGARVLCLAARIGTEVKAFLDLGAFAVGVDINPDRRIATWSMATSITSSTRTVRSISSSRTRSITCSIWTAGSSKSPGCCGITARSCSRLAPAWKREDNRSSTNPSAGRR
jgi:hypothetical protein